MIRKIINLAINLIYHSIMFLVACFMILVLTIIIIQIFK